MQFCENDLGSRKFFAIDDHIVHGNATSVIDNCDRIIDMDRHIDLGRISRKGFVHRIVDHLVDKMMQPHLSVRTDVHRRTKTNGLHALKNFYVFSGVVSASVPGGFFCIFRFCCLFRSCYRVFNCHSKLPLRSSAFWAWRQPD